mmetsp:Transcript_48683/g.136137  ORF Transcript_48683/g.136137 Transcript_48683/m.136137 type:complete len:519 (+) Transcript_48683:654-2210(+)
MPALRRNARTARRSWVFQLSGTRGFEKDVVAGALAWIVQLTERRQSCGAGSPTRLGTGAESGFFPWRSRSWCGFVTSFHIQYCGSARTCPPAGRRRRRRRRQIGASCRVKHRRSRNADAPRLIEHRVSLHRWRSRLGTRGWRHRGGALRQHLLRERRHGSQRHVGQAHVYVDWLRRLRLRRAHPHGTFLRRNSRDANGPLLVDFPMGHFQPPSALQVDDALEHNLHNHPLLTPVGNDPLLDRPPKALAKSVRSKCRLNRCRCVQHTCAEGQHLSGDADNLGVALRQDASPPRLDPRGATCTVLVAVPHVVRATRQIQHVSRQFLLFGLCGRSAGLHCRHEIHLELSARQPCADASLQDLGQVLHPLQRFALKLQFLKLSALVLTCGRQLRLTALPTHPLQLQATAKLFKLLLEEFFLHVGPRNEPRAATLRTLRSSCGRSLASSGRRAWLCLVLRRRGMGNKCAANIGGRPVAGELPPWTATSTCLRGQRCPRRPGLQQRHVGRGSRPCHGPLRGVGS